MEEEGQYLGGDADGVDFSAVDPASNVVVVVRDPPCTSFFAVPRGDRLVAWSKKRPGPCCYEVVRGPCRLVVELVGPERERAACAAEIAHLLSSPPQDQRAHHLTAGDRTRLVFPATAFPSLSGQHRFVTAFLVPRLAEAHQPLVDRTIYADNYMRLWPVPSDTSLLTRRTPSEGACVPPKEWVRPAAPRRRSRSTRKGAAGTAAAVDSIQQYLTLAIEGSRPVVRRGHTNVFLTLAAGSTVCPRKGAPHRHNHASFVFCPATLRGWFQCMDSDCSDGAARPFRWGDKCYCVEATSQRCHRCRG